MEPLEVAATDSTLGAYPPGNSDGMRGSSQTMGFGPLVSSKQSILGKHFLAGHSLLGSFNP